MGVVNGGKRQLGVLDRGEESTRDVKESEYDNESAIIPDARVMPQRMLQHEESNLAS